MSSERARSERCGYILVTTTLPSTANGLQQSPISVVIPCLSVTLHSASAILPTKGSDQAAGYDLYAAEDKTIAPMDNAVISTDISIKLPPGCYGRIAARSGLAVKYKIIVGAGVIDYDYTGIVKIVLFNFNDKEFVVCKGNRIAQLICERIEYPCIFLGQPSEKPCETERGSSGFGSTGI